MLKARWILPVSRPPINGGWLRISGNQILEVGEGAPCSGPAEDLGDVALLPGLINAHCHLEFSDCVEPIGTSGIALPDWIGQVIVARRDTSEETKRKAISQGLRESAFAGVRLIGEITTPPCIYPSDDGQCVDELRPKQPKWPDVITFAEVLGLTVERGEERMAAALEHNAMHDHAGWSPHAPYSTSLDLIESCVAQARKTARPVAMHVAESPYERELLTNGSGPFSEALRNLGVWQPGLFPWGEDPVIRLVELLAEAPRALLVHGNDLRSREIEHLRRNPRISVVYCPRTHAFFGYGPHPVNELLSAGVHVALGTDSRASNPDLNLWREVQHLLKHRQDLDPSAVLTMATTAGAEALGRSERGRIAEGCHAELGLVRTSASTVEGLYDAMATSEYVPFTP